MKHSPPVAAPAEFRTLQLHPEIAAQARRLWESYGRPLNRDEEIWQEAESQVLGTNPEVSQTPGGGAVATGSLSEATAENKTTRQSHPPGPPPAAR